jgi:hypothetical protein
MYVLYLTKYIVITSNPTVCQRWLANNFSFALFETRIDLPRKVLIMDCSAMIFKNFNFSKLYCKMRVTVRQNDKNIVDFI